MIGYNLAVSLLYRGIGVIVGMPIFIRYMKLSDYTMAIFGCVTTIIMFILLAFATKLWMVFAGMFIFAKIYELCIPHDVAFCLNYEF